MFKKNKENQMNIYKILNYFLESKYCLGRGLWSLRFCLKFSIDSVITVLRNDMLNYKL